MKTLAKIYLTTLVACAVMALGYAAYAVPGVLKAIGIMVAICLFLGSVIWALREADDV